MKKYLLLLLVAQFSFGQIPTGYYNTASGTGYVLKTQLFNKIGTHTTISYTPGLWNLYYTSDVRTDGKVWDIYSNCNFIFGTFASTGGNQDDGTSGTSECQKYNREHTFPKSWFNNTSSPMYSDAFHIMPSDKKVNGLRGNLAYGIVGSPTYTSGNGTKIGNCVAPGYPYNLLVCEPTDIYKGDIARNYFYMATCYEDIIGSWQNNDADANTVLDGTSDKVYETWFLNMLLTWHINDPVSQKEIDRNNAIYSVQGNRNPFIDHPEYVCQIWSTPATCATLFNNSFLSDNSVIIYPNPTNSNEIEITTEEPITKLTLVNTNGQIIKEIVSPIFNQNTFKLNNLQQGFYFLKINAEKGSLTKKIIVN